jgi:hypothetical protein
MESHQKILTLLEPRRTAFDERRRKIGACEPDAGESITRFAAPAPMA